MGKSVLYLGDTAIEGAASYLAGVMHAHNIAFDYLPSDERFSASILTADCRAVIISDYPARNFSPDQLNSLAERVAEGVGLLMLGGWESFTGSGGDYNNTVLKDILPVVMRPRDDRMNCPQPCLIEKVKDHEIVNSLPFDEYPPSIGGFNRFTAKGDAETILLARRFDVCLRCGKFLFTPSAQADPLLVLGSCAKSRVCAFATDAAPHWVGGLVDWGDTRLEAQAPGANAIEVGNYYAELFANLINWTARKT